MIKKSDIHLCLINNVHDFGANNVHDIIPINTENFMIFLDFVNPI